MTYLIHGLVLAGGQGRRMGGADKALVPFGPATLLDQAVARLAPQVVELAVSANGDPARLARFGLPILPDSAARGPLSGLLQGLIWATARGATHLVTVPVDAPFLPGDLVPRLLLAGDGGAALARAAGRPHPVCALWPVGTAPALEAFLASGAEPRVMDFAVAQGARLADFPDDGAFSNVNTPADLAAAQAMLSR